MFSVAVGPVGAAAAVLIGVAVGTNGLALALRTDPEANVGGSVIAAAKSNGLAEKAVVGGRSGVFLEGFKTALP